MRPIVLALCGLALPVFLIGQSAPEPVFHGQVPTASNDVDAPNVVVDLNELPVRDPHWYREADIPVTKNGAMRAMPVLPLSFSVYAYLRRPNVKGLLKNSIDTPRFSDVWIDTSWRPT